MLRTEPSSAVPSVYHYLPSTSIPLPSYALPLSHRDSQTTTHIANLISSSTATSILHAHLHSLDLPPPNVTGTHSVSRKPRKRARLSEPDSRSEVGSDSEGETTRANADGEDSELAGSKVLGKKKGRPLSGSKPRRMPVVKSEGVALNQGE